MTLSLLWPVRTVYTTCSIYKEHSSMTVVTSRHESVVWGVVLWNGCRTGEAVPVLRLGIHPAHGAARNARTDQCLFYLVCFTLASHARMSVSCSSGKWPKMKAPVSRSPSSQGKRWGSLSC